MSTAAQVLGKFAAEIKFEAIPSAVIERAKDCVIDTVGVCTFGVQVRACAQVANEWHRSRTGEYPNSDASFEKINKKSANTAVFASHIEAGTAIN